MSNPSYGDAASSPRARKLDAVGWPDMTPERSQCSEADLLEEQVELAHNGFISPGTQAQIASLTEQDYVPGYRRPRDYSWLTDLTLNFGMMTFSTMQATVCLVA